MKNSFKSSLILMIAGLFFYSSMAFCAELRPKVGSEFPEIRLKDRKGREFSLKDFRGGVVLLNFWATWCPPCIEEMPSMDALNHSFKARRFNLLAVSVDTSWSVIDEFFGQLNRKPSFLILLDSNRQVAAKLGVDKFPESFLISKSGRLLKHYIGSVEWLHPSILAEVEAALVGEPQKSQ